MSSCPSVETLSRLGLGPADDARFRDLERHIEGCPACQAVLERLARGEPARGDRCAEVVPGATGLPQVAGFVIEKELGRGGMSVVYRAWQPRLMRRVALKLLVGGPASTSEARARGLREAHSISRVRDPRVVHLHDVGDLDGMLYLVLEYVPGGSLKSRLQGPLSPCIAALLVEQIAGAVAAVHRAGLLHLDLKPSNILLDSPPDSSWEQACPRVADFGISRLGDEPGLSQTLFGAPCGTPSYMAPEQLEPGRPAVGPSTDVYALGAILYELLTGRPPFQAATVLETLEQVRDQDPVPLRRINPALPRDLETICLVCLHKTPERRYATATALADDLRRWREGLPIQARPLGPAQRSWRIARRHPLTAGLIAVLALTILSALAGMLVLWQRAVSQRRLAERSLAMARANYDLAARSLGEISEVAFAALADPATAYPVPVYLQAALEKARNDQLELFRENAPQWQGREQIAVFDSLLGSAYQSRGRETEARFLLKEAVELWEERIVEGKDLELALGYQLRSLGGLGPLLLHEHTRSDLARWSRRVDTVSSFLLTSPQHTGAVFRLCQTGRRMADTLAMMGATELAHDLLEADRRRFEAFSGSSPKSLEFILCRALALAALGQEDTDFRPPGVVTAEVWPGSPGHTMLINALAELAARRFGLKLLGNPANRPRDQAEDDDWAGHLVEFLRQRSVDFGLPDASVPAIAWSMRELILGTASDQRRVGKLDDACRTARHMKALSRILGRSYPNRAEPQLIMSEAHVQDAKNAYRRDDQVAAWQALENSLEAAIRASSIEPASEEAHRLVIDRRHRLDRLQVGGAKSR